MEKKKINYKRILRAPSKYSKKQRAKIKKWDSSIEKLEQNIIWMINVKEQQIKEWNTAIAEDDSLWKDNTQEGGD